jgi:hypothetical protein
MLASLPFVKQFFAVGKNVGWVASGYWMLRDQANIRGRIILPGLFLGLHLRLWRSEKVEN